MRIVVSGLWHLGCVTAACLAEYYEVVAHDPNPRVVARLQEGEPPLFEPGLTELLEAGHLAGRLTFSAEAARVAEADVVWITHDTPVNERDEADVDFIARSIAELVPLMRDGALVVISSQVPAGFIADMELAAARALVQVTFAYVPENLRLGQALAIFRHPDRVVVGVRSQADRERLAALLAPFSKNIVWMSPESAEMTKHALNAFLATSVTFINEIAGICERVGADVKDVERGLKSESRIGPHAYLSAGSGFAGGTLARDVRALTSIGHANGVPTNVLDGVLTTNTLQSRWVQRTLERKLGELSGRKIAMLGLTYKPGTDTLRRSTAIDICRQVHALGATVAAYDPVVRSLPRDLVDVITLKTELSAALDGADAIVVGTHWPQFRELTPDALHAMRGRLIVDPGRWLENQLGSNSSISYIGIGSPAR